MKLNDLISENTNEEVLDDVLFEEDELNEVYKGKRYFSTDFQEDVKKFTKKVGKEGNPFKELLKDNKVPAAKRDLGSEVKGLPNAKDILSLVGEYREHQKVVQDLADDFDKWKKETGTTVSRITDDDKNAHKSMPKTVKERLNKFYNQYKHYAKVLPKAAEKAKKVEPAIASAKNKSEEKGRVKAGKEKKSAERKASTDKFKSNVKNKVKGIGKSASDFKDNFKNKVKGKASSKEQEA